MYKIHINFTHNTKLAEIVLEHIDVLIALEHFSIKLGLAEQTIEEIALQANINLEAFVAILKIFSGEQARNKILTQAAIPNMLSFLRISHYHFKNVQIPELQSLIHQFAQHVAPKHGEMLVSFFDGYIHELNEHFLYEDEVVFPYINGILSSNVAKQYKILEFETNHSDIEQKLLDLKNILIKYIVELDHTNFRKQILYGLNRLETELLYHTIIEDELLVPSVKQLEEQNTHNQQSI